ncbi:MAG TPA: hypothetical protein VGB44_03045 [Flavobacterium sp.]|jgi:YD repeat-containing protein
MKKTLFLAALLSVSLYSCDSDDDASDNLSSTARYIKTVSVVNTDDGTNETLTVNYDADGRVSNVTDGFESSTMVYNDNNELITVTGESDPLSMSDLYQAPYDAYEYGDVLEYDSNGNPSVLQLFDISDEDGSTIEYTGEITYDAETNPFLHTLDKAGILDVLDNIDLNFSTTVTSQELVSAKLLLPSNNPKRMVVKTLDDVIVADVVANYVYNADGYPTSATFTTTTDEDVSISSATYTYLP